LDTLGTVLEQHQSERLVDAVLQDPNRDAIETLRQREGLGDVTTTPLNLEEIYTALLARHRRGSANGVARSAPIATEEAPAESISPTRQRGTEEGGRP
jgi:hypothetical protein